MRSSFTLTEGASEIFHYSFSGYTPGAADVVVACAKGECSADSKAVKISADGRIALKPKKIKDDGRAASEAVKKDNECAILHDSLRSLDRRDASLRAFTAKFGEAETLAMAKRVRRSYEAKACETWLEQRGGVGAAWRRVRVSQWTSFKSR